MKLGFLLSISLEIIYELRVMNKSKVQSAPRKGNSTGLSVAEYSKMTDFLTIGHRMPEFFIKIQGYRSRTKQWERPSDIPIIGYCVYYGLRNTDTVETMAFISSVGGFCAPKREMLEAGL